jgi:uncharacterized protein (TIGR00369 family)
MGLGPPHLATTRPSSERLRQWKARNAVTAESAISEGGRALASGDLHAATESTHRQVPLHRRMGLRYVRFDEDSISVTMEMSDEVKGGTAGSVHGGMLATLADVASASALNASFDANTEIPVTTDLHVRYYRQPTSGPLTAEAHVVHRGRRLLSTECSIVDADQRVLARSTATYMIVPL